jgi:hypothetical protein
LGSHVKNRPFSFVFLSALAAALLVELGMESYPLLFSPRDRGVLLWRLREAVGWEILPYALLALLVPFVRLPASSRWVLIIGFFIVGGIGIFELGRLSFGGGEVGFAGFLCFQAQVGAAAAASVLALVAKGVQHLFAKNVATF